LARISVSWIVITPPIVFTREINGDSRELSLRARHSSQTRPRWNGAHVAADQAALEERQLISLLGGSQA
jgi:hypothetical protein